jgi:hypothetical protein
MPQTRTQVFSMKNSLNSVHQLQSAAENGKPAGRLKNPRDGETTHSS